jgi:hypothetical protein
MKLHLVFAGVVAAEGPNALTMIDQEMIALAAKENLLQKERNSLKKRLDYQ